VTAVAYHGPVATQTPRFTFPRGWALIAIICWNYLYLAQKFAEIDDLVQREEFLQAMSRGSAAAWEHINLLGEYDLSEDKLKDSVGIKLPKLTD
jgi:hypothetical protein